MACRVSDAKPFLNQCLHIVNWTLGNKLQGDFNRNWYISIQQTAFECGVWKITAILSQPQCVKKRRFFAFCIIPQHLSQDKMATICRRHFQNNFRQWKKLYFNHEIKFTVKDDKNLIILHNAYRRNEPENYYYHQKPNIRCTLVGNKLVDHSDVLRASPVGAAATTSFST